MKPAHFEDDRYLPRSLQALEERQGTASVSDPKAVDDDPVEDVREQEEAPQTSFDYAPDERPSGKAKGRGSFAKRAAPGGLIGLVLALGAGGAFLLSPGLLLVQLKETMVEKFNDSLAAMDERAELIGAKRMAKLDGTTQGVCAGPITIRCRYHSMSNRQVKKMERGGKIKVNGDRRTLIRGRVKPDSFTFDPGDGSPPREISASQFRKELRTDPDFRRELMRGYNPKLAGFSDRTFGKFAKRLNLTKEKNIKGDPEKKKMKEQLLDHTSGDAGARVNSGVEKSRGEDGKDHYYDTSDPRGKVEIEKAAYDDAVSKATRVENELKSGMKDMAKKAGKATIKGALTSTAFGLGAVDSACTGYRLIRTVGFAAKILGAYQLVRYAQVFMNAADSIKAGDADPEQVSYLATILTTPNSEGKTATDSFGYQYAAYNNYSAMPSNDGIGNADSDSLTTDQADKVALNDEVLRYRNGQLVTNNIMSKIIGIVDGGGGSTKGADKVCKFVKSGWGQALLIGTSVAGAIVGFFTGGASVTPGAIAQGVVSVAMGVAIALLTPKLVAMAAGQVITGDENGNQAGNAITSGMGAYNAQLSQSRGLAVLNKQDAVAYAELTHETEVAYAQVDRIDHSPLDPTSRNTFVGALVEAMIPMRSRVASLAGALTLPGALLRQTASVMSPTSHAADGGEYDVCPDAEYTSMNLAADPFCNLRYGLSPEALQTDPDDVLDYMTPYIDETTGEAKSGSEYETFIKNCVDRQTSIGGYTDDNDDDGTNCIQGASSDNTKYTMFRLFYLDQSVLDGMDNGLGSDVAVEDGHHAAAGHLIAQVVTQDPVKLLPQP